jgi:hypothetical protein
MHGLTGADWIGIGNAEHASMSSQYGVEENADWPPVNQGCLTLP